jgi:hypothetical protein
MTERQRVETEVCRRVCDCASALRAECWPDLGGLQAIKIAVKVDSHPGADQGITEGAS